MFSDGSSFLKRVSLFRTELTKGRYPNAATLSSLASCSRSTAQRVIDRLRDEYLVPLRYDSSRKGYYLSDPQYDFEALPPGKDELTSLLLMRDLANTLGDPELKTGIGNLWSQYQASNTSAGVELADIVEHFSSACTEVAMLADNGAITYLNMAAKGESVDLGYKSPWRHETETSYRGHIEHVHLEDHNLYILFREENGNERILNTAFVMSIKILDFDIPQRSPAAEGIQATNWLEGFGIWSGANLEDIEIELLPPASRYYARQRWAAAQEDFWDGDVLVRRMQAILSPELVRKILGLGRFVRQVRPEALRRMVLEDAEILAKSLASLAAQSK